MESLALDTATKGTTGRLKPVPIPPWVRRSFQLTASVAPGLAASWAGRVFFTPQRARVRPDDAEALSRAEPFSLPVAGRTVRGWTWAGQGAPVLLIHGWGGHTGQMASFARALSVRGRRTVGLDMPGHGLSEGTGSSLVHFQRAIEAAARVFGPFSGVVAHSFGCAGTTYALSRWRIADRAVFIAPPSGFQSFWSRFCEGLGVSASVWERVISDSEERLEVTWAEVMPAALAPQMKVPLMVVHDRADSEIAHDDGEELASLWPGAELVSTAGLGHHRILRDDAVIQRALGFLGV